MAPPIVADLPVTEVIFWRTVNNQAVSPDDVIAEPTVAHLTVSDAHTYVDLAPVTARPDAEDPTLLVLDLVATDDEQVNETFGWRIRFANSTRPTRLVAVPQAGPDVTYIYDENGDPIPRVWLDALADFTGASGPVGSDTATTTSVTNAVAAHNASGAAHAGLARSADVTPRLLPATTTDGHGPVYSGGAWSTQHAVTSAELDGKADLEHGHGLAAVATSGSASDLTAGVLDDARIPASITRDDELAAAVTSVLVTLRDGAPEAYDTFLELLDRITDDEDALAALVATVSSKADQVDLDAKADSADLADVATSGDYSDLAGTPTIPDSPDDIGAQPAGSYAPAAHTHPVADVDATGTPGATTYLRGDGTWATPTGAGGGEVDSVNGETGAVVLDAADVGAQPTDPDLTALAGLDSTQSGAIASDGAGWLRKTYAQLKTALGLVKGDVGLDNVANTAPADLPISTATQSALDAKAATSHAHAAGDVTSGTFAIARIPTGTSGSTAALGDHTHSGYAPTTHKTSHATGGSDVLTPSDIGAVPVSQRGPIGGVQALTDGGTVSVDATLGVKFTLSAGGNRAISVPTGGVDGQEITMRITASGAARTLTFNAAYEIGQNVTTRTLVVASGLVAYVRAECRGGSTWRLLAIDNGS